MGKPSGLNAGRKLLSHRREQRWADKDYKKRALGTAYKHSPFGGSSHAKGIVVEKIGVEAKQPNSAIRKCVRVQLIKNGKKVTAFVPNDGCLNFVEENVCVVDVCLYLRRMKFLLPDSEERERPRVISQECDSSLSRCLVSLCLLSTRRRRRSQDLNLINLLYTFLSKISNNPHKVIYLSVVELLRNALSEGRQLC
jgi:ribosomal protein uS12